MTQMTYVITGGPGVGKHQIAAMLDRRNEFDLLDANEIAKDAGIIDADGQVDTDKLGRVLEKYEDNDGRDRLMVGHLAPYALESDQVDSVFVLRRSPYVLEEVYARRQYTPAKTLENLGAEILGVVADYVVKKFGSWRVYQIDNSTRTPEETLRMVERVLDPVSDYYAREDVDWLAEIKRRGDMKRFFEY